MSFTRWRSLVDGTEVDVGSTIPDSVVDNFNDVDDPEQPGIYEADDDITDFYTGGASSFSRTTAESAVGETSLVRSSDDAAAITSLPGTGLKDLNNYVERGDTVRCWIRRDDTTTPRAGVLFAVSSETGFDNLDCYMARPLPESGIEEFRIERFDDGDTTTIAASTLTPTDYPAGEWFEIDIEWASNNDINATFKGAGGDVIASANDSTYSENVGVGFLSNTSTGDAGSLRFDGYEIID